MLSLIRARVSCVALLCLVAGPALPDAQFVNQFQTHLAAADLAGAEALANAALAAHPDDAQARFALGAVQFLGAVEHLGQGLYDHGLEPNEFSALGIPTVTSLPFLRLPVGRNPAPQPFDAAVFRQILTRFGSDLLVAEATLAQVPKGQVSLPLNVQAIALDFNRDGKALANEAFPNLITAISGVSLRADFPVVGFDESDVIWLRGYSHLLAGITDILLAHDWTETVNLTFQSAFPQAGLPSAALDAQRPMLEATLRANLSPGGRCYDPSVPYYKENLTPAQIEAQARRQRCYAAENALSYGGIGDLVAFVHLFRWPVVEPARLLTARQHFLTMIALSRENWASIRAETDDDAEWVPGPKQTSLFPRMRVTEDIVSGWMEFLDQAEGVLEGRLLLAHWRFDKTQGVNLRKMFEEPRTLDPVLILTGMGALPYMEKGELAAGSTMNTGMRMLEGGLFAYFLWFN